jgi:dipeptidyl aminopeptidase/acylaminoacyl peptidase
MRTVYSLLIFLFLFASTGAAQNMRLVEDESKGRPMTFEDMYQLGRVSDPQVSPDGMIILYVVTFYSVESNSSNSDIYSVGMDGKNVIKLTDSPKSDNNPRWSPDGKTIAFVSSRDNGPQLWFMNPDGSQQRKITNLSSGVSGVEWSPTGTHLLFTSSVYADCKDDDCNHRRDVVREQESSKARIIKKIPFRVWNSWKDDKWSHVFVLPVGGGVPMDVTPGEFDTPPIDIAGHADYAFSPDGKEIAFVKNTDPIVAASTNNDIWLANIDGSNARCITAGNRANDNNPVYSPDGRYIAYRAMSRPGYEADRYNLIVYERATGKAANLTAAIDRSVDEIMWSKDGKSVYFSAQDEAYNSLFEVPVTGGNVLRLMKGVSTLQFHEEGAVTTINLGTTRSSFRLHPDGKHFLFLGQRINYPAEVMSALYEEKQVKEFRQLTNTNKDRLALLDLPSPESFTFPSVDGTQVQGWILTPPQFDPAKKYPMIFLVHGGPQGVWGDDFHYRWNMELFAAPGFVVVAVNPRGSTGFGQAFTDGVNGDWGGKPYKDLMTGLDFVLKKYPFIDKNRIGAAGASYGGYMMDWFLGNTNRFKCIFTHSGVYDLRSMYGGTEELWFPEWEFQGTPWKNPKMYEKWSPSSYAKNFKTPTLVSHGQLDFRVPVEQSIQLFNTLQRMGVESQFMYFPDEGHTILKPRNAMVWYREFASWFKKHLME